MNYLMRMLSLFSYGNRAAIRRSVKMTIDAISAFAILTSILYLMYQPISSFMMGGSFAILMLSNIVFGLSKQQFRTFGFRDMADVGKAFIASTLAIQLLCLLDHNASIVNLLSSFLAVCGVFQIWIASRLVMRVRYEAKRMKPLDAEKVNGVIIVGGGVAGLMIANEIRSNPQHVQMKVLGFVDDHLKKQRIKIQGIPVLGTTSQLPALIEKHQKPLVVIAIPSAGGVTVRRLSELAQQAGSKVVTVPGLFAMLNGEVWKPAIKPVSIEDLLRRDPIQLDHTALKNQLQGKTVLVTGAGGSIGSEICRQVAAFHPGRLILLGRGEGSLWAVEQNLRHLFPEVHLCIELCDIRNKRRLNQVFKRWKPEVVFHAAAHKHVPFLEEHPEEAVENNIFGTHNVVTAALRAGTHTFVNISTDKAINPTNVLGASKYLAERLVLKSALEAPAGSRYVSVRFGNVLGSRGSVISIFKSQIEKGGPITITHPDMRRFFMTIPEASQLVLQAGLMGGNGKVYVLDMGEAVRIEDLAKDMIKLAGYTPGKDIEITFSGVRPGEKLFEEVFSGKEKECLSIHPKVREAMPIPLEQVKLEKGLIQLRVALNAKVRTRRGTFLELFQLLIPGYKAAADGLGKYEGAIERNAA